MEVHAKNFGDRLNSLMAARGTSASELARALGVTPQTVLNWKAAKKPPLRKYWKALSNFFGLVEMQVFPVQYPEKGRSTTLAIEESSPRSDSVVASRSSYEVPRRPSTRADCENYFARYLDLAAASGDPDAFPAIMRTLKKSLPISDWDASREPPS